jgi:preprotein translocase subunit YajC
MQFLPLIILAALMYVMLVRPQQRRVRAQRQLVASLGVGDEVVTVGGLVGRIIELDDLFAEVETTPGVVLKFRRVAISGRLGPDRAPEIDLDNDHRDDEDRDAP